MKVGVTGAGGLLGSTLVPLWRSAGADVTGWTRAELDVTDAAAVRAAVGAARPDVVVHAAAWTDVDGAEGQAAEAMRVNHDGAAAVAAACADSGARLVHVSSDYIFSGRATTPIPPEASRQPQGAYGRSKAEAERAVMASGGRWLIVRTGWLYGPHRRNFVDTMRAAAAERRAVRVVTDQTGAPTSARLVAEVVWGLVAAGAEQVWHAAAAGATSWHGVACAVFDEAGAPVSLVDRCTSAELRRPAARPAYSVLDCGRTIARLGVALPAWEAQVRHYVRTSRLAPCGIMDAAPDPAEGN